MAAIVLYDAEGEVQRKIGANTTSQSGGETSLTN